MIDTTPSNETVTPGAAAIDAESGKRAEAAAAKPKKPRGPKRANQRVSDEVAAAVDAIETEEPEVHARIGDGVRSAFGSLVEQLAAADEPADVDTSEEAREEAPKAKPDAVDDAAQKIADALEGKKPEAAKPVESEAAKIRNQHNAVTRRLAKAEAREKAAEARERAAEAREKAAASAPNIAGLDELGLLIHYAERAGKHPAEVVRTLISRVSKGELRDAKATPAAPTTATLSPVEERIAKLEAALTQKAEAEEAARLAATQQSKAEEWIEEGMSLVAAENTPFPLVAADTLEEVQAEFWNIANRVAEKTGVAPRQADVLDYMEKRREKKLAAWSKNRQATAEPPAARRASTGIAESRARTLTKKDGEHTPTNGAVRGRSREEQIRYAADVIPDNFWPG